MNQRNYQKELDKLIEGLGQETVPTLLLHVCCAPCSSYVLEYLSEYFEITVFFYNPNLTEKDEYIRRRDEEIRFISEISTRHPVHFSEGAWEPDVWRENIRGLELEKEGGKRCEVCFRMRLEECAKTAAEGHFDYFTTTLTISPLKNAALLNRAGEEAADKFGTVFLPSDFKKRNGYLRSTELSRIHNLYRQDYCGCVYSKRRDLKKD